MKKLTLSGKLAIGFGALILLILVLGSVAVWRINLAVASATDAAVSHAPEVRAAATVHGSAWNTRLIVRSYELTGNPKFLIQAREQLGVLKDELKVATGRAEKDTDLAELSTDVNETTAATSEFAALLDKLEAGFKNIEAQTPTLDTAAKALVQQTVALRTAQRQLLTTELANPTDPAKLKERIAGLGLLEDSIDAIHTIRIAHLDGRAEEDSDVLESVRISFIALGRILDQLKPLIPQETNSDPVAAIREAAASYQRAIEMILKSRVEIATLATELAPKGNRITDKAVEMNESGLQSIIKAAEEVTDGLGYARLILMVGSGIALLAGILIAWVSARAITLPIRQGISALASTASQISATIAELASSASETAAAVAETTTTLDEVRQTAQVAADKAKAVADSAKGAAFAAEAGRKATAQTTQGLNLIRGQMDVIGENISRLNEQSQAVADIVNTVTDLAEQSNLLAVNASIEAAKAGEMGRGFAVVAHEIRNLAEQSKDSTRQVRGILGEVQKATGKAVMASDQGIRIVADGSQQADDASQAIAALTGTVQDSTRAAVQIAASSQQQLVGMDQVGRAMENIKGATAQNAEGARQLGEAARSLQDIGARLQALVSADLAQGSSARRY